MKVLITGGSGLVGGRLIQHLLDASDIQIRAASRRQRPWPDGVEGCVADIGRPWTLPEACCGVDAVVNLSSMSERASSLDPVEALRVNAGGALALASAAAEAGVRRLVQVSTYKVYGNNPVGLITEDSPSSPQSHYATTHRAAEDYARWRHPNCVVFRPANGFGAPIDPSVDCWDIIANDCCRQAARDRRIELRSSGSAWRNFVPMDDLIRALRAAIVDLPPGTYHVGTRQSGPLRDLAGRIADMCEQTLGFRPSLTFGSVHPGEANKPLDYRVDKLAACGVEPGASVDVELARLLRMSEDAFGRT